jgi:hypothetical protein
VSSIYKELRDGLNNLRHETSTYLMKRKREYFKGNIYVRENMFEKVLKQMLGSQREEVT